MVEIAEWIMDFEAYVAFLKKRAKDFRSIAAKTNGDMTVEDLHNEAWLVAEHVAGKRGEAIEWSDRADQSLIFGILTVQHVWKTSEDRKRKVSADQEKDDGESITTALLQLLPTDDSADPLELLERREEEKDARIQREKEDEILETYSESVAYIVILWHFNNIRAKVATYLVIDRGTLKERIDRAAETLKAQPSLFDRIERITQGFMPLQGHKYFKPIPHRYNSKQMEWAF
jgi:hypothetical protein